MDVVAYTLLAAAIAILSAVITSLPVLPHHITASASEKTEAAPASRLLWLRVFGHTDA